MVPEGVKNHKNLPVFHGVLYTRFFLRSMTMKAVQVHKRLIKTSKGIIGAPNLSIRKPVAAGRIIPPTQSPSNMILLIFAESWIDRPAMVYPDGHIGAIKKPIPAEIIQSRGSVFVKINPNPRMIMQPKSDTLMICAGL